MQAPPKASLRPLRPDDRLVTSSPPLPDVSKSDGDIANPVRFPIGSPDRLSAHEIPKSEI
jgi:hypothetical protein